MEAIKPAKSALIDPEWQQLVAKASAAARKARNEGSMNSSFPSSLEAFDKAAKKIAVFFKSI